MATSPPSISQLPSSVVSRLRSETVVPSFARAIEELVCNSIDAGARRVSVKLDCQRLCVTVEDDGEGVPAASMPMLGTRWATSKLASSSQLEEGVSSLGFRGAALASIADSSLLEVTSKARGEFETYAKTIKAGKLVSMRLAMEQHHGQGTTVTIKDFLFNKPVRKSQLLANGLAKELQEVRERVFRLALVYLAVGISIVDTTNLQELLQLPRERTLSQMLPSIFGDALSTVVPVKAASATSRVVMKGYATMPPSGFHSKARQYMFINQWAVRNNQVSALVNALFLNVSQKLAASGSMAQQQLVARFPAFAIWIQCPASLYDMTYDPSKSQIVFADWSPLLQLAKAAFGQAWGSAIPSRLLAMPDDESALAGHAAYMGAKPTAPRDKDTVNSGRMQGVEPVQAGHKASAEVELRHSAASGATHPRGLSLPPSTDVMQETPIVQPQESESRPFLRPSLPWARPRLSSLKRTVGESAATNKAERLQESAATAPSHPADQNQRWHAKDGSHGLDQRSSKKEQAGQHQETASSAGTVLDRVAACKQLGSKLPTECSQDSSSAALQNFQLREGHRAAVTSRADPSGGVMANVHTSRKRRRRATSAPPQPKAHRRAVHTNPILSLSTAANVAPQHHAGSPATTADRKAFTVPGLGAALQLHNQRSSTNGQTAQESLAHGCSEQSSRHQHLDAPDKENCHQELCSKGLQHQMLSSVPRRRQRRASQQTAALFSTAQTDDDVEFCNGSKPLLGGLDQAHSTQPSHKQQQKATDSIAVALATLPAAAEPAVIAPGKPPMEAGLSEANAADTNQGKTSIDALFAAWRNPSIKPTAPMMSMPSLTSGIGCSPQTEGILREDLQDFRVLNQVYDKFIMLMANGRLLAVDQHAADERVRLEQLQRQVMGPNGNEANIKSAWLRDPVTLGLGHQDMGMYDAYKRQIERWGWRYTIDTTSEIIVMTHQPKLLDVLLTATDLKMFLQQLDNTQGCCSVPPAVMRVLNSKACRSAIMFGDVLTMEQCTALVEQLRRTQKFQICAHGRPTMAMLLHVPSFRQSMEADKDPLRAKLESNLDQFEHLRGLF